MNATITRTHTRKPYKLGKSIVYVECPVTKLVDKEFFDKHKIWELNFKCVTWNAVKRMSSKYTAKALESLFPAATIKYSAKAGCQCGCSPGYRVTHSNQYETGKDVWVDITYDENTLNQVRDELVRFEHKLQKEIFSQKENVG